MAFIIMKSSRVNQHAPLWFGYRGPCCGDAGVEPGKVYHDRNEAVADAAKMNEYNTVGFAVVETKADIYLDVAKVDRLKLWVNHSIYYIRQRTNIADFLDIPLVERIPLDEITRYTNGHQYMLHTDLKQEGVSIDQITVSFDQKIEVVFNKDWIKLLAERVVDYKPDNKGNTMLGTIEALMGDRVEYLPVRSHCLEMEPFWIVERLNPHHKSLFGLEDMYVLTPLGTAVCRQIEETNSV